MEVVVESYGDFTVKKIKIGEVSKKVFGEDYFVSSSTKTKERWIVYKNGTVVDSDFVITEVTVGMNGLEDHWSVCQQCGKIKWITGGDECSSCIQNEERERYIAYLHAKNRSYAPKGVVRV